MKYMYQVHLVDSPAQDTKQKKGQLKTAVAETTFSKEDNTKPNLLPGKYMYIAYSQHANQKVVNYLGNATRSILTRFRFFGLVAHTATLLGNQHHPCHNVWWTILPQECRQNCKWTMWRYMDTFPALWSLAQKSSDPQKPKRQRQDRVHAMMS